MARTSYMIRRGIKRLLREFKENITIKLLTSETTTAATDVRVQTFTDYPSTGAFYSLDSEYIPYGFADLRAGEVAFLLDNSIAVTDRDRIVHRTITYQLYRVEPLDSGLGIQGYAAYGKRVDS